MEKKSPPPYRVVAVPTCLADAVRRTGRSPFAGHPVHGEVARGHGPCRHCLRTFRVGEERRLLFTFDPFAGLEPFPLPGPVFIHEEHCDRYPETAGFPRELASRPLSFEAYARGRRLVAGERVENGEVDSVLAHLLAISDVDYLHVRDTEAGCYDLRIERRSDGPAAGGAGTSGVTGCC